MAFRALKCLKMILLISRFYYSSEKRRIFFHFRNMDVSNFPDMKSFADKLAKMAPGESLKVENVPADQIMKVKMNMTLSGYIQVNVAGNTVSGSKPNVSPIFFSLFKF